MILFVQQHSPSPLLSLLALVAPLTPRTLCASPLAAAKETINEQTIRS